MKLKSAGNGVKGLYVGEDGKYYCRPTVGGKRTTRVLKSRTLTEAVKEYESIIGPERPIPFADAVEEWLAAGCPNREDQPRSSDFVTRAAYILSRPVAYFKRQDIKTISRKQIKKYGSWRASQVKRDGYSGTRAADIDLATCASMCWWLAFDDRIKENPFAEKMRFHKAAQVSHSPARAPADADQVHAIGRALLNDQRTASCGFLWMFLALTGCRTKELRLLRLGMPAEGQRLPPGWFSDSEIVIQRGKRKDSALDVLKLSDPARDLLRAWKRWHDTKKPESPWWFPGRNPQRPLDVGSLCRAVKKVAIKLGFPNNISPHGCRSFFCSVLRTTETDDRIVADALGHSNVNMVQSIYGKRMDSKREGQTWLPKDGKPGWERWSPSPDAAPMKSIPI